MSDTQFNGSQSLTVSQVLRAIETVDPSELLNELTDNPFRTSVTDLQPPSLENSAIQPQLQNSNVFLPFIPEQNIFPDTFDSFAVPDVPTEQTDNALDSPTYYTNETHIQDLKWTTLYATNNFLDLQITTNKLFNKNSANSDEGLCFYYNTKNTRLVFHLSLKLVPTNNTPISSNCIAKISLVKKRNSFTQPSDSIHQYVELLSARDSGKPNKLPAVTPQQKALTLANGDDTIVLTLNQNLSAAVDLTIWDVSSKHLFMKNGSGLKGCDAVGCQCDGAVKDMCFMVEVYTLTADSQELSSLLLSVLSEPFEIKSKYAKPKGKRTASQISPSNTIEHSSSSSSKTDSNINNNASNSTMAKKQKMQVHIPVTNITSFKWKCKRMVDADIPFPLGYHTCCTVSIPDAKSTPQSYSILFGGRTVVSGLFGRNKNVSEQQLSVFVIIFDHQTHAFVTTDIVTAETGPEATPQGRSKHTCVAINSNNFLIFGGETLQGPMSDLYLLTVTKTSQRFKAEFKKILPAGGFPIPRFSHCAVLQQDPHQEHHYSMIIYGGETLEKKELEDVWILDFQFDTKSNEMKESSWRQPPSFLHHPGARSSHTAVILEEEGKTVMCIFGGAYRAVENGIRMVKWRNDCWCLNLADWKWREVLYHSSAESHLVPRPRDGHVCLPVTKTSMLVYGGWTGQMKMSRALQGLSANNDNNSNMNEVINKQLVVGLNFLDDIEDAHFSNDLWIFDLASKVWTPLKVKGNASPAVGHSVGAWVTSSSNTPILYLFGGETFPPKIVNSVWKMYPKTL